jgi:hypothetical protein
MRCSNPETVEVLPGLAQTPERSGSSQEEMLEPEMVLRRLEKGLALHMQGYGN